MAASQVFKSVGEYKTAAGFFIPCLVVKGYDSGGVATAVQGSVVTADLILLGYDETKLSGVTLGTGTGQFQFGL